MSETHTNSSAGPIGLVLIGGESRRMGRDKARLEYGGQPLYAVMRARLLAAGCAEVWLAGDRHGLPGLPDPEGFAGPLAGIATAVARLPDGARLLIVPTDMPRLSPELLGELLSRRAAGATRFGEYCLPLCLRVDATLRRLLEERAGRYGAEQSVSRLFAALGGESLALPEDMAGQLANANTPEEWARLMERTL